MRGFRGSSQRGLTAKGDAPIAMSGREGLPGILLRRAPELAAAVLGAVVGLARSSFGTGLFVFVIVSLALEFGLELREWLLQRSPDRFRQVVKERAGAAGLASRHAVGDETLFSAPVLVSWRCFTKHQVFAADGRLIAAGESLGGAGLHRLFGAQKLYSTPAGRPILQVYADRTFNPRSFGVSFPGDREFGLVSTTGRDKGSVYAGSGVIGQLKKSRKSGLLPIGGRGFSLYNAVGAEVAYITTERRFFTRWNVVEVGPDISEPLRTLLLAADAAVDWWTAPKGGGG